MITFERRKQDCLGKDDKSSIGGWDKHIVSLCEKINKLENYYTLSSCSGRIVLLKNLEKKQPGMFVFRSHEKIRFEQIKKALENYRNDKGKDGLIFKQEQPILHVACKTLDDAEKMLKMAQEAGFKHSGIMSIADSRIVVEIIGSEQLALPIFASGKIPVDDDFLKMLVKESNSRLEIGWSKIKKLEKGL
jgi:tRNA wybutosine-synthesizing protein 3